MLNMAEYLPCCEKVTRRVLVTCKAYYSSVPVNVKLKSYVKFENIIKNKTSR